MTSSLNQNIKEQAYLSWVLMWFNVIPESRINLDKHELIPMGRVVNIDDLVLELG